MIYIVPETTVEEILEDLAAGGCTLKDLIVLAEGFEEWEHKYPSNYPRSHFDEAAKKMRAKARVIREAIERYESGQS